MPIDSHKLIQLAKFEVKFSFIGRCQTLSQADRVTNRLLQFLFDCCLLQTCHIQAIKICLFPKGCLVHLLRQDALVSEGHQVKYGTSWEHVSILFKKFLACNYKCLKHSLIQKENTQRLTNNRVNSLRELKILNRRLNHFDHRFKFISLY